MNDFVSRISAMNAFSNFMMCSHSSFMRGISARPVFDALKALFERMK